MKSFRIAICALILLSIGVFTNSSYIERLTEDFVSEIDEICENDTARAKQDIERIYKKFKKAEKIISITTSHDDLTTIEEGFAEMRGAVHADDMTAVITIKSRLKSSFQHLGRLSGINIDSLI